VVTHETSVGQAIVNGNLLELAEDHYFGDSNSFLTRYAAILRSTVRQMKTNSLQEEKYYDGPDFEYVRKDSTSASSLYPRTQKLVTLAQTVARGSWMSATQFYNKMMSSSEESS